MSTRLTTEQAYELLLSHSVSENVVDHCKAVSSLAVEIAEKVKSRGHPVDTYFVETAALLHDIGRSQSHGIDHGVKGAEILRDYPEYALVCERHVGAGITADEAGELGLPEKDYFPQTLEEKIITHADNLTFDDKTVDFTDVIEKYSNWFGKNHPALKRLTRLNQEITDLTSI